MVAIVLVPSCPSRSLASVAAVAVFIALALGGVLYWHSRNTFWLTASDTVVLADFSNLTGNRIFERRSIRGSRSHRLSAHPWATFNPMMPSTISNAEPSRITVLGSPYSTVP